MRYRITNKVVKMYTKANAKSKFKGKSNRKNIAKRKKNDKYATLDYRNTFLKRMKEHNADEQEDNEPKSTEQPAWLDTEDKDVNAEDEAPKWATIEEKCDDEDPQHMYHFTNKVNRHYKFLPSGSLEFEKLMNANKDQTDNMKLITGIEFHPQSTVILLTDVRGSASLFSVDGSTTKKLHGISLPKQIITCARFTQSGDEAIISVDQGKAYSYNLAQAKALPICLDQDVSSCRYFEISPDNKYVAIIGQLGKIHILSTKSKESLFTIYNPFEVSHLKFSPDSKTLFVNGESANVNIWNMQTRRMLHSFCDEGCVKGNKIDISYCNKYVATGSNEGIVNVYKMKDVLDNEYPIPFHRCMNLITAINDLKFNSTSEILGYSSLKLKGGVRFLHMQSKNNFRQFPELNSEHCINLFNFSPSSGYLALGTRNGLVPLYRLKHYSNY